MAKKQGIACDARRSCSRYSEQDNYMEEIHNLVTGCLVPGYTEECDDSEDEGGDDDIPWVGYKDVGDLGKGGKSLVTFEKPKRIKGNLIDLQTGRSRGVAGGFHITDPWWQVTILRTKKNKEKVLEPRDYFALCYRLRDDEKRFTDGVVHLFLSKLQDTLTDVDQENGTKIKIASWFSPMRTQFNRFLKERSLYDDLDLSNLEERLETYVESFPVDERTETSMPVRFKKAILLSAEYNLIKVGEEYPELLHYIPQLFPGTFKRITSLDLDKLDSLKALLTDEPGLLAFKPIVSKECGILGCETSYEALTKSGLLTKVPQNIRDAILMYEFIKKETRENGHTYVHFSRIMDVQGPVIQQFEEALEFLNKNKVTKTLVENGERNVFLTTLWKAENKISCGINSLIKQDEKQPWKLEVDWDNNDFDSIKQDNDQLRAARLIASKPVVAISGKGGCGKTYVVTKVITAAKASRQKQNDDERENGFDDTCPPCDNGRGAGSYELMGDYPEEGEKCPEKIQLLLTAPTGKAANLLGKRAKSPSFTLHQVIYSYRNQNSENPWKHKDVNTLVVDECSLVSVSTFSFLIQLLQDQAKLRKIVLLGDVRQLPSIEPGNFLTDTFTSLSRIGCAVELRNNHRAESTRIVDNATRISKKTYPEFHPEQFSLMKLPPSNPSSGGDDYTAQDISMKVMQLLKHDALKDHVTSQFISFTRKVCDSINDLCCKNYSDHRTKEHGKFVFRTGDKICCTKNGYVNLYEEHHGVMSCQSQPTQCNVKEEESEGGVERTVNCEEDTSLLGICGDQSTINGSLNTTAGSSNQKQSGSKKTNQIRLCNGEIFFVLNELETKDDTGKMRTFLQLSDRDAEKEFMFWVDKGQIKKACKIRHAWARTIHTFQGSETDNVIYIVGSGSWRQNWQHVYTAVTRGRKSVFIIGREDILRNAIKRSEIKRQTSLRKQLLEKLQKNKEFNTTKVADMSTMNTTAFQPTTPIKGKNSAGHGGGVPVSHGLPRQPMITEFTTAAGNTTLNNTQIVTDILSSLASEHDDPDGEWSEIEEYDSEDSQSLFTNIKPATGRQESNNVGPVAMETRCDQTKNKQTHSNIPNGIILDHFGKEGQKQDVDDRDDDIADINHSSENNSRLAVPGDVNDSSINMETVESKENNKEDNESDPESDDSQSLISPPTTRARARAKAAQQSIHTNTAKGNESKSNSGMKNSDNHRKTCESGGTIDMEDRDSTTLKGRNNRLKLSLLKGKTPLTFSGKPNTRTPLNLSGGRRYRYSIQGVNSPITPVMSKASFSPDVRGAQNTSSPVTDMSSDFQCQLRSGISPLISGCNELFTESKSVLSDARVFEPKNRSMTPSNLHFDRDKRRRLSELDDIKEPLSNESVQWSEIDESDYLKLVDESNLSNAQQQGNLSIVSDNPPSVLTKQALGVISDHRKSLNTTDVSVNSQWSEMDDEQYMTLDLVDISSMTFSTHGNKDRENNDTTNTTKSRRDKNTIYERHISESNVFREEQTDYAEIYAPDSPPSPSILETPPKKLKLSSSRKQGQDRGDYDINEVSPLKRSLSKLKFK